MIIPCIKYPHQSKLTMNYKHVFVFFCYLSILTIQVNSRRRRKISRFRKAAGGTFDFGCSCGKAEQRTDRNKHNISLLSYTKCTTNLVRLKLNCLDSARPITVLEFLQDFYFHRWVDKNGNSVAKMLSESVLHCNDQRYFYVQ